MGLDRYTPIMDMLSNHVAYALFRCMYLSLMCLQSSAKHNILCSSYLAPRTSTGSTYGVLVHCSRSFPCTCSILHSSGRNVKVPIHTMLAPWPCPYPAPHSPYYTQCSVSVMRMFLIQASRYVTAAAGPLRSVSETGKVGSSRNIMNEALRGFGSKEKEILQVTDHSRGCFGG